MGNKQHTITVKVDKNNKVILEDLPFAAGEEIKIVIQPVALKTKIKPEEGSEETFISEVKSFSESLVIATPELEDDDFATFMGEVKSPEVGKHSKSFIGRLTSRYRSDQIKKKKKSAHKLKIPKHKVLNKADKIINRSVSKKVIGHFCAALRVILDHKKVNFAKESISYKLPSRFLAPNDNCEMEFCTEKEAQQKNGIHCDIQINKQVLEMQGRKVISRFVEHYEDRPYFFLGEIDPIIFTEVCSIMEKRQSKWKGVFRFPYRARQEKKEMLIEFLRQRKSRIKKERSRQIVIDVLEYHKQNPDADFHFRDVAKVERFLTANEKEKVFIDMRKNLKVEVILPILQKILGKMTIPYYNVLVTGKLLSSQSTSFNHRPASFGIVKIDEDKVYQFKHRKLQPCLTDQELSKKLEKVLTGKVMYEEAHFNKNAGGQREELEDLLIPSQEIKKNKKLPDYDSKIKQNSFLHLFYALYAITLAFLPYAGIFWSQKISLVQDYAVRYISSFLVVVAVSNLCIALSLLIRKGRLLSMGFNVLLITSLVFLLTKTNDYNLYLLYAPWLVLSFFMFLRFCRPTIKYYFYKDFGPIYAKVSFLTKLFFFLILIIFVFCNLAFYYPKLLDFKSILNK